MCAVTDPRRGALGRRPTVQEEPQGVRRARPSGSPRPTRPAGAVRPRRAPLSPSALHPSVRPARRSHDDPAGDVVRWAAFSCLLVPVVLVVYGTSFGGTVGATLGLAAVTAACRVLLRHSEKMERATAARAFARGRRARQGRAHAPRPALARRGRFTPRLRRLRMDPGSGARHPAPSGLTGSHAHTRMFSANFRTGWPPCRNVPPTPLPPATTEPREARDPMGTGHGRAARFPPR